MPFNFHSSLDVDYSDWIKTIIAGAAFALSLAAFFQARSSAASAKRSAAITQLLGEKECVAFGALKLLRDGLSSNSKHRALEVAAVIQACVFERSDRARALLYRVIEINSNENETYRDDFQAAAKKLRGIFEGMKQFEFTPKELNLSRGEDRLKLVERIIERSIPSA